MSIQRYYVLIVGGWKAADAVPEYYVTEAMETTTGVMVSADPEAALARFQDLNLANEYAAWKNGQPAEGLTFTGCTFSPPLERSPAKPSPEDERSSGHPFHVEREGVEWHLYMHNLIDQTCKMRVRTYRPQEYGNSAMEAAMNEMRKMNSDFKTNPEAASKTAHSMARALGSRIERRDRNSDPGP